MEYSVLKVGVSRGSIKTFKSKIAYQALKEIFVNFDIRTCKIQYINII